MPRFRTTLLTAFACVATTSIMAAGSAAAQVETQSLADRIDEVLRQRNSQAAEPAPPPAEQGAPPRTLSPRARILQKLLYTKVDLDFNQTRAQDALNFLRTVLDINMIARYLDDVLNSGIDPDAPITLKLTDMTALDALEMILEQCGLDEACDWQLRSGFLEIGPKSRLASEGAQELRVYPVDDILFDAPDFYGAPTFRLEDELAQGFLYGRPYASQPYYPSRTQGPVNGFGGTGVRGTISSGGAREYNSPSRKNARADELIDLVTRMIEPELWDRNGGTGASIEYRDGAFIVRAPDFVHRQLAGYPEVPKP